MYGFVRAAAVTPKVIPGDVDFNVAEIAKRIDEAKKAGAALAVFPELCLCGYTAGDLLLQSVMLDKCEAGLSKIAENTNGIAAAVGLPVRANGKLYNAAAVVSGGEIIGVIPKTNLPNYGEFYEARHFTAGANFGSIVLGGKEVPFGQGLIFRERSNPLFSFGVEICEDMWVAQSPSVALVRGGAHIICNLSASVEVVGKAEFRRTLVKGHSAKLLAGYIYADCGCGESTTDSIFAGHRIIAEDGCILKESELFTEGLTVTEIDVERIEYSRRQENTFNADTGNVKYIEFSAADFSGKPLRSISTTPFLPERDGEKRADLILSLQAAGLRRRMDAVKTKKLVVGISGGLDSALALTVAVRAADRPEDVTAVTMPCFGTGSRTLNNARALSKALNVTFKEIPIADSVTSHLNDIGHGTEKKDTVYENAQARERTQVLMDIANELGALVVGTGDMSELALGWTTYNGDHMSSYGVNGSVPKTLVKYLVLEQARAVGGEIGRVLTDIAKTEISPELLPQEGGKMSQKTEEILGKYIYHDFFLYYAVRWGFSPKKILYLALSAFGEEKKQEIKAALKLFYERFFSQQFKRSCMPDGVKVGTVSLSPRSDWRMPSDASAALWLDEVKHFVD